MMSAPLAPGLVGGVLVQQPGRGRGRNACRRGPAHFGCGLARGVLFVAVLGLMPLAALVGVPVLLVMNRGDYSDPYWAMKLVTNYERYYEIAAREQFIVIHIACEEPETQLTYVSILQEALILYPGDINRLYLDVSMVYEKGRKLSEAPGFCYMGDDGNAADPDGAAAEIDGVVGGDRDVFGRFLAGRLQ